MSFWGSAKKAADTTKRVASKTKEAAAATRSAVDKVKAVTGTNKGGALSEEAAHTLVQLHEAFKKIAHEPNSTFAKKTMYQIQIRHDRSVPDDVTLVRVGKAVYWLAYRVRVAPLGGSSKQKGRLIEEIANGASGGDFPGTVANAHSVTVPFLKPLSKEELVKLKSGDLEYDEELSF